MKKKVLLIDDSVTIHRVIDLSIDADKYDITKVFSGEDARLKLSEGKYDFILLDNKLEGINAADFVAMLKGAQPESRIILLVGAFDRFGADDLKKTGADDYLVKPFDSQSLNAKLAEGLREEAGTGVYPETEKGEPEPGDAAEDADDAEPFVEDGFSDEEDIMKTEFIERMPEADINRETDVFTETVPAPLTGPAVGPDIDLPAEAEESAPETYEEETALPSAGEPALPESEASVDEDAFDGFEEISEEEAEKDTEAAEQDENVPSEEPLPASAVEPDADLPAEEKETAPETYEEESALPSAGEPALPESEAPVDEDAFDGFEEISEEEAEKDTETTEQGENAQSEEPLPTAEVEPDADLPAEEKETASETYEEESALPAAGEPALPESEAPVDEDAFDGFEEISEEEAEKDTEAAEQDENAPSEELLPTAAVEPDADLPAEEKETASETYEEESALPAAGEPELPESEAPVDEDAFDGFEEISEEEAEKDTETAEQGENAPSEEPLPAAAVEPEADLPAEPFSSGEEYLESLEDTEPEESLAEAGDDGDEIPAFPAAEASQIAAGALEAAENNGAFPEISGSGAVEANGALPEEREEENAAGENSSYGEGAEAFSEEHSLPEESASPIEYGGETPERVKKEIAEAESVWNEASAAVLRAGDEDVYAPRAAAAAPAAEKPAEGGFTISISREEIVAMLGGAIDRRLLESAVKEVLARSMEEIVRSIVPAMAEKYIKAEIERLKNDE